MYPVVQVYVGVVVAGSGVTMPFATLIVTDCVGEVPPVPVHEPVIVVVAVRTPVDTLVPEVPDFHAAVPFFILQDVALFEDQEIFDD